MFPFPAKKIIYWSEQIGCSTDLAANIWSRQTAKSSNKKEEQQNLEILTI